MVATYAQWHLKAMTVGRQKPAKNPMLHPNPYSSVMTQVDKNRKTGQT